MIIAVLPQAFAKPHIRRIGDVQQLHAGAGGASRLLVPAIVAAQNGQRASREIQLRDLTGAVAVLAGELHPADQAAVCAGGFIDPQLGAGGGVDILPVGLDDICLVYTRHLGSGGIIRHGSAVCRGGILGVLCHGRFRQGGFRDGCTVEGQIVPQSGARPPAAPGGEQPGKHILIGAGRGQLACAGGAGIVQSLGKHLAAGHQQNTQAEQQPRQRQHQLFHHGRHDLSFDRSDLLD